jgi:spore maturation protein SpmB
MDSTTITLFSEIQKGTGKPNYTDGRTKGGESVNAIANQIWVVLTACLLLTILHRET